MSKEEKLLNEWIDRLGLQDWAIVLRYNCNPDELRLENVNGETEYVSSIKSAVIRLLDPKYSEGGITKYDLEEIIVHELLHIKFSIIGINPKDFASAVVDETIHRLIDDLARAFVNVKRNKSGRALNCERIIDKNKTRKEKK